MINANIPLLAGQQQTDLLETAGRGLQFGQGMRQLLALRQAGKMSQIDDENERKAFANNSMFSRELNAALKADQTAKAQALMAQQKHEADTAKTWSDATKNNADAGKIGVETQGLGLKNSGVLLENANRALTVAAQTGDPMAAKLALNNAYKAGAITPELYEQYSKQIDILGTDPKALKQFAQSITLASAEKPDQYLFTTADNVLDNQTAVDNNIRTTQASMYSTDVAAETADKNRVQNQQQFEANFEYKAQQDEIKNGQGEVKEFGGKAYIVYKDGTARQLVDQQGRPVVAGKVEAQKDRLERISATQDYANSAQTASEAAKLAAELANDLKGLNSAAGGFGLMAKVPGSDAKTFATKLETLKSNVFLGQVSLMKGMGALTDAEGARLEKSIAALDLSLSPQELQQNLTYITQTMSRAAKSASQKAQLFGGVNTIGTQGPTQQATQNAVNAVSFFD